ncbi:hypothetical protein Pla52o_03570 [Novipirellula galeiformis]|uniref:DUF1844 domain-containing protein n=1 Tax=Novipirellula galeiformis TaxID=2528004 RepID=A0A5C6CSH2_9BACT|nr:DUF1844 domain-containing protein [Novipirellula galeiformis]TWU26504.1 hypothetical protein Pla52o_03570 [Novipirellula galeiformis]
MSDSNPTNGDSSSDEPKIVVDSDWKEQVAKEKEAASANAAADKASDKAAAESEPVEQAVTAETPAPSSDENASLQQPPPASFEVLISMLFTQAMATLGQIPDPSSGEAKVNKPFAKHYIDTIEMLGGKTKGNLSEEESKMLSEALHALRMMYVNTK